MERISTTKDSMNQDLDNELRMQFARWLQEFAITYFNGDRGLALLELELRGFNDE